MNGIAISVLFMLGAILTAVVILLFRKNGNGNGHIHTKIDPVHQTIMDRMKEIKDELRNVSDNLLKLNENLNSTKPKDKC